MHECAIFRLNYHKMTKFFEMCKNQEYKTHISISLFPPQIHMLSHLMQLIQFRRLWMLWRVQLSKKTKWDLFGEFIGSALTTGQKKTCLTAYRYRTILLNDINGNGGMLPHRLPPLSKWLTHMKQTFWAKQKSKNDQLSWFQNN